MVTQLHCSVCGGPAPLVFRCTNGCCARCHAEHCTPGGATYPGHGLRVYAVVTALGTKALVKAGTVGFYDPQSHEVWQALRETQSAAQTGAALAGSMFGWDCPGARIEYYNEDGTPKSKRQQREA